VNLVNNAIKFTQVGSVTTRVTLDGISSDYTDVRFTITDTGIGIPADRLDRLFKSFSQVDASTTRNYGGTGLGLVISRQLAELMGGKAGVESTVGRGSTFWFTVRLRPAVATQCPVPTAAVDPHGLRVKAIPSPIAKMLTTANGTRRARILIAEDNRVNQIIASEVLARHGYDFDVAENGRKAVAKVLAGDYDLVLMDCSMPELDGFEATRLIRQAEQQAASGPSRHMPIIALTANAIKGDRQRCLDAGMDDYVSKPLDPESLIKVIQAQLSKVSPPAPKNSAMGSPPALTQAATPSRNPTPVLADAASDHAVPVDIDDFLSRCMGDLETALLLLEEFERQAATDVQEIKRHVDAGDCQATAQVAHALKGAAGILSARALCGVAFKLEQMGRSGRLASEKQLLAQLDVELRRCVGYLPAVRAAIAKRATVACFEV
jgi:CheY-like chemotaxis protein